MATGCALGPRQAACPRASRCAAGCRRWCRGRNSPTATARCSIAPTCPRSSARASSTSCTFTIPCRRWRWSASRAPASRRRALCRLDARLQRGRQWRRGLRLRRRQAAGVENAGRGAGRPRRRRAPMAFSRCRRPISTSFAAWALREPELSVVTNGVPIPDLTPRARRRGASGPARHPRGQGPAARSPACSSAITRRTRACPILLEAFAGLERPYLLIVGGEKRPDIDYDRYLAGKPARTSGSSSPAA